MTGNKHGEPYIPSYRLKPSFFECDGKESKKTTDFCSVLTKAPPPVYAGVGVGLAIGAGIITAVALTASAPVTVPVVLTSVTLLTVLGVSGICVGNYINESQNQSNHKPESNVEKPEYNPANKNFFSKCFL